MSEKSPDEFSKETFYTPKKSILKKVTDIVIFKNIQNIKKFLNILPQVSISEGKKGFGGEGTSSKSTPRKSIHFEFQNTVHLYNLTPEEVQLQTNFFSTQTNTVLYVF